MELYGKKFFINGNCVTSTFGQTGKGPEVKYFKLKAFESAIFLVHFFDEFQSIEILYFTKLKISGSYG